MWSESKQILVQLLYNVTHLVHVYCNPSNFRICLILHLFIFRSHLNSHLRALRVHVWYTCIVIYKLFKNAKFGKIYGCDRRSTIYRIPVYRLIGGPKTIIDSLLFIWRKLIRLQNKVNTVHIWRILKCLLGLNIESTGTPSSEYILGDIRDI